MTEQRMTREELELWSYYKVHPLHHAYDGNSTFTTDPSEAWCLKDAVWADEDLPDDVKVRWCESRKDFQGVFTMEPKKAATLICCTVYWAVTGNRVVVEETNTDA